MCIVIAVVVYAGGVVRVPHGRVRRSVLAGMRAHMQAVTARVGPDRVEAEQQSDGENDNRSGFHRVFLGLSPHFVADSASKSPDCLTFVHMRHDRRRVAILTY